MCYAWHIWRFNWCVFLFFCSWEFARLINPSKLEAINYCSLHNRNNTSPPPDCWFLEAGIQLQGTPLHCNTSSRLTGWRDSCFLSTAVWPTQRREVMSPPPTRIPPSRVPRASSSSSGHSSADTTNRSYPSLESHYPYLWPSSQTFTQQTFTAHVPCSKALKNKSKWKR